MKNTFEFTVTVEKEIEGKQQIIKTKKRFSTKSNRRSKIIDQFRLLNDDVLQILNIERIK